MKKFKSITWVHNLYEVGTPIRNAAKGIEARQKEAVERLEKAKRLYEEEVAQLNAECDSLEKSCQAYWPRSEIAAAKQGYSVVDGVKIKVEA